MKIADVAWLAGLLEGEGSFLSRPESGQPRITLDMTDKDIVERAAALLGVAHVGLRCSYPLQNGGRTKPTFILRLDRFKAASWMMTIYPFMGVRRAAKIRECLETWRTRKRRPNGWTAHRMTFGCHCQANTGSCAKLAERMLCA